MGGVVSDVTGGEGCAGLLGENRVEWFRSEERVPVEEGSDERGKGVGKLKAFIDKGAFINLLIKVSADNLPRGSRPKRISSFMALPKEGNQKRS